MFEEDGMPSSSNIIQAAPRFHSATLLPSVRRPSRRGIVPMAPQFGTTKKSGLCWAPARPMRSRFSAMLQAQNRCVSNHSRRCPGVLKPKACRSSVLNRRFRSAAGYLPCAQSRYSAAWLQYLM